MSGILNNSKISKIQDNELEDDLDKTNLNPDKKAMVIAELTRRRIREIREAIIDLKKSIDKFSKSSDNYSRKLICLTLVIAFLTFTLVIPTVLDFIKFFKN